MHKVILGLAAAGLLFTAIPAFSQVAVEMGPGGVEIQRDRDHERYRDRDRHEEWRAEAHERHHCRTISERHERDDGRIVVRHIRRCD
jgi:hypothetical protein